MIGDISWLLSGKVRVRRFGRENEEITSFFLYKKSSANLNYAMDSVGTVLMALGGG